MTDAGDAAYVVVEELPSGRWVLAPDGRRLGGPEDAAELAQACREDAARTGSGSRFAVAEVVLTEVLS